MLPKAKRQKTCPEQTFNSRCFGKDDCLPTFMAAYGSQHLIDEQLLRDKGLMMHFFQDCNGARLFHPIEIALAHMVIWCTKARLFPKTGHQPGSS